MKTDVKTDVLVQLKDVRKSYRLGETRVQALRGIDLTVRRGEFMSLVGASGSGKSTLLNLIGCIDEPDGGAIELEGIDVLALSEAEKARLRNRHIGFVFQTFNLVPVLTVTENVDLPLSIQRELSLSERSERVAQALKDVGLQDLAGQLPDKLSGGQRQRVAIARALVTRPSFVLADEPTANLDSETANRIVDLLLDLNAKNGVTFLFSTHDEKLMARVTRVVRIKDGRIEG